MAQRSLRVNERLKAVQRMELRGMGLNVNGWSMGVLQDVDVDDGVR